MTPARTPATQPIFHGWWIVLASGIGQHGWRAGYFVLGRIVLAVAVPIVAFVLRDTPAALGLAPDGGDAAGGADPARRPA